MAGAASAAGCPGGRHCTLGNCQLPRGAGASAELLVAAAGALAGVAGLREPGWGVGKIRVEVKVVSLLVVVAGEAGGEAEAEEPWLLAEPAGGELEGEGEGKHS